MGLLSFANYYSCKGLQKSLGTASYLLRATSGAVADQWCSKGLAIIILLLPDLRCSHGFLFLFLFYSPRVWFGHTVTWPFLLQANCTMSMIISEQEHQFVIPALLGGFSFGVEVILEIPRCQPAYLDPSWARLSEKMITIIFCYSYPCIQLLHQVVESVSSPLEFGLALQLVLMNRRKQKQSWAKSRARPSQVSAFTFLEHFGSWAYITAYQREQEREA
jgi:hypothetical protein